MGRITIKSTDKEFAIGAIKKYLEKDFVLINAYSKKKLFGKKWFIAEFEPAVINYKEAIAKASAEQRFEDAYKLKLEYEENQELLDNLFYNHVKLKQAVIDNIDQIF